MTNRAAYWAVSNSLVGGWRDVDRERTMSNVLRLRKINGCAAVNVESSDAIAAYTDQKVNPSKSS
jgi:hypothetical protein